MEKSNKGEKPERDLSKIYLLIVILVLLGTAYLYYKDTIAEESVVESDTVTIIKDTLQSTSEVAVTSDAENNNSAKAGPNNNSSNSNASKLQELAAEVVEQSAALKTASITVIPMNDKETPQTLASNVKKLRVNFTLVKNALAKKGDHTIYLRVFDPYPRQIIADDSGIFDADSDPMTYTYKAPIKFTNTGKTYSMDWTSPVSFTKGPYILVLYADGHTIGEHTIALQ